MRRFRPITVNEPTEAETLNILRGVRPRLERHHGLKIDTAMLIGQSESTPVQDRGNICQEGLLEFLTVWQRTAG